MSTEIATQQNNAIVSRYQDDVFNELTIQGSFLPRVNLYTGRSKLCERGIVPKDNWGVMTGKDKITVLGENIHCVPLAYRPMALDLRDKKAVAYFDPSSPKFTECKNISTEKDSKCMAGIQFLLYIQNFGLATYYCASKSAKMLAPKIRKLINGYVTLGSHTVEAGEWVFRAPTIVVSNVEFELPHEEIAPKKQEFLNVGPTQEMEKDQEGEVDTTVVAGGTADRPR